MQDLFLPATRQTPEVNFAFSRHSLSLIGEAYPENATAFFTPLGQAIDGYLAEGADAPVSMKLALRYMNSASTKMVFQMMAILDGYAAKGPKITILFEHDPDDDMMIEFADDLKLDYTWLSFSICEIA